MKSELNNLQPHFPFFFWSFVVLMFFCLPAPSLAQVVSIGEINVEGNNQGKVPVSSKATLIATIIIDRSLAEPGEEIKTIEFLMPAGFSADPSEVTEVLLNAKKVNFTAKVSDVSLRIELAELILDVNTVAKIVFKVSTPSVTMKNAVFRVLLRNFFDEAIGDFVRPGPADGKRNNDDFTLVVITTTLDAVAETKVGGPIAIVATNDGVVEVQSEGTHKVIIDVPTRDIKVREGSIFIKSGGEIEVYNLKYEKTDIIDVSSEVKYWLDFVILPDNRIAFLDNRNDKIYFGDFEGNFIASIKIKDKPDNELQNLDGVVVENYLIFSETGDNELLKIDLDTYEVSIFRDLSNLSGWLGAIDYSEGTYYICQADAIYRFSETEAIEKVSLLPEGNITGIVVQGSFAYVTINFSGKIYKVNLQTGEFETFSSGLDYPQGIELLPDAIPPKVISEPSFTLSLSAGLNFVSLPMKPDIPYTARSFAEKLSSTLVIRYDAPSQEFVPFVPEVSETDGFVIEGGQGYIVNVLEEKQVTFTGSLWTNTPPASPQQAPDKENTIWAFAVAGLVSTEPDLKELFSELRVTVKNQRTGQLSQCAFTDDTGEFAVAFVDMSRKSVVRAGDMLEISVRNSRGQLVSVPVVREVSKIDLAKATVVVNLRLSEVIPSQSQLFQNYPNPFNPETWIPFQLAQEGNVTISIYNINGQLVRILNIGHREAGLYLSKGRAAYWDGRSDIGEQTASGVYFYTIKAGGFRATRRMVILR